MHAFLSQDWAGLAMAVAVLAIGIGSYFWLRKWWLSAPIALLGIAMMIGSGLYLWQVADMEQRYPAPGKFADIEGQAIHYLDEGKSVDGPTIVLFGGGHAPGTSMQFLHDALKRDYRSVLIDRPGMGWSGPASFPLSTHSEAKQMWEVLDAAGVDGPVLLGGHSFGGLLAANMARLRPERVHSLVLMDATPTDVIIYGPRLDELSSLSSDPWWNGFFRLFALDYQALKGAPPTPPQFVELEKQINKILGEAAPIQEAFTKRARAQMAAHSIFNELTPQGMASVGYETGFFAGELGEIPLFLFAPKNSVGITDVSAYDNAEQREAMRMTTLYAVMRERYLDYSNNSMRIVAPEGTGHNFIYERPEYTIGILRQIADGTYEPDTGDSSDEQKTQGGTQKEPGS